MRVVGLGPEIVRVAEALLDVVEAAQIGAEVMAGFPVDRLALEEARQMVILKFLSGVNQRRALFKVEHGGEVFQRCFIADERRDARLVVVLEEAEFVIVCGVRGLLEVDHVEIVTEHDLPREILVERLADVVFIFHVERGERVIVQRRIDAAAAREAAVALVDGLGQPDAVRVDLGDGLPRGAPELDRHERRHVAAEAVDDLRPHHERVDLIGPEVAVAIVEVDDVCPVAHLIAGLAIRAVIEELRMLGVERGVRRGVVVDDVDHALHAALVDLVHERLEIVHRAIGGIDSTVVAVGIRAAEAAFFALHADRVDRQEPDDVRAESLDAVEIGDDRAERALRRMGADVDGVNDLILQVQISIDSHK